MNLERAKECGNWLLAQNRDEKVKNGVFVEGKLISKPKRWRLRYKNSENAPVFIDVNVKSTKTVYVELFVKEAVIVAPDVKGELAMEQEIKT